jgi:hypothetical protein
VHVIGQWAVEIGLWAIDTGSGRAGPCRAMYVGSYSAVPCRAAPHYAQVVMPGWAEPRRAVPCMYGHAVPCRAEPCCPAQVASCFKCCAARLSSRKRFKPVGVLRLGNGALRVLRRCSAKVSEQLRWRAAQNDHTRSCLIFRVFLGPSIMSFANVSSCGAQLFLG